MYSETGKIINIFVHGLNNPEKIDNSKTDLKKLRRLHL